MPIAAERLLAAIGEPQMIEYGKDAPPWPFFLNRTMRAYPAFAGFYGWKKPSSASSVLPPRSSRSEERKQILYLLGRWRWKIVAGGAAEIV